MNSADKQAVLHCLKSMIDEEVCEECPLYGTTGTDHCEKDCVRLAIKALEQEPCGDCISRKQAIELFAGWWSDLLEYHKEDECFDALLKTLPPVTPQPKKGKWIMSDDGLYRPICNNCGAHPWKGYVPTVEEATEVFKYCPNCGCAMKGELE